MKAYLVFSGSFVFHIKACHLAAASWRYHWTQMERQVSVPVRPHPHSLMCSTLGQERKEQQRRYKRGLSIMPAKNEAL